MSHKLQDILQQLTAEITVWLTSLGIENPEVQLDVTTNLEFGEYSTNVAMRYAKVLGKSPLQIAGELVENLQHKEFVFLNEVKAVNPGFVNFYFTLAVKSQHVESIISARDDFGKNNLHLNEKWVIEHTSPNPNKAMHLGHLRNNLVGMGIVRLLKLSGAEVVSDAVYNNRGIAIAKVMYGYLAHMKTSADLPTDIKYWSLNKQQWHTPESKQIKPDQFVTDCYVLAEKDFANPEVEAFVRQLVVDWEAEDDLTWQLWETVLEFAYTGINHTLRRLGSHWDNVWYEHEHYQAGKEYVETGLARGIFKTLEDGAVLTNLEDKYNLSDTVLLKSDGTSLYITQDIALTDLKKKKYDADKLVWVIGPDQTLALKQVFAVCEQLEIGKLEDFTHVSYGYVGLKDEAGGFKKMSSRAGTVVLIDDVIDEVKAEIKARFVAEAKYDDVGREELSEKLALAAVKFSFLKSDRNQDLQFDVKQSIDIHGDSGLYVMYAYVRTESILRKAAANSHGIKLPEQLGEEASLLRSLLYFDYIVEKATADLSVHHVAQYLLEISGEFNRWYAKETVLDGGEYEGYKLSIVRAVGITLKNGLNLLGINTVEEM